MGPDRPPHGRDGQRAGGELGGLSWFAVTWALMIAAMMLPAVAPMVAAHRRRAVGRGVKSQEVV
ncbi:MAG TPA: DUF2182 domain-containing protein [Thermoleophilaceae bacterium]|nr:DUF2182 domain-containing protein [Thermoleophilaceae bacterium]